MIRQELFEGLAAGALVVAVLLWIVLQWTGRAPAARPAPLAGYGIALGALAAIQLHRNVPLTVLAGLVGIGLAWDFSARRGWPAVAAAALALAPAALLGIDASDVGWVVPVVALAGPLGVLAGATDRQWSPYAVTPALFAVSAGGVFACVPDTEEAAALLGVALAVATLGWPFRLVTLGPGGAGQAVAVLAWVAAVGGRGRPASIIGALACVGLLAGLAAGAALAGKAAPVLRRVSRATRCVAVITAQVVVVALASRWAGLQTDPVEAAALATFAVMLSLLAGGLIAPPAGLFERSVPSSPRR